MALAEPPVGHPDHRGVHDLRMHVKNLLDFPGKKLLAAAVDDLLAASGELNIARFIDIAAEIAGPEPAVGREGLLVGARIVMISEMHRGSARGDLADIAVRNLVAAL